MHALDRSDQPAPVLDTRGPDPHPAATATSQSVELVVDGDQAVEWVSGDVDLANCGHVLELGAAAIAEPRVDALVVELSGVTFLDSTGLGALVQLRNLAKAAGKRLRLRGVPPPVSKLLTLTRLDEVFGLTVGDAGRC